MKVKQLQKPYLTVDELDKVLEAARDDSPRNHCMFLMGYLHGLRTKELAELKVTDIRDEHLHIQRCKGSMYTRQPITPWKGNRLKDEVKALKAWMAVRDSDDNALFTSRKTGRALSREQVSREFHRIAELAGMPKDKRFAHVLKHSLATHLCEGNAPLMEIKQTLGHQSITSTMRYARSNDFRAAKAKMHALQHYQKAGNTW